MLLLAGIKEEKLLLVAETSPYCYHSFYWVAGFDEEKEEGKSTYWLLLEKETIKLLMLL